MPAQRPHLIVKLRKIEALDKAPHQACAMVRLQKPVKVNPVPAQLSPVRPYHPRYVHRRFASQRIGARESQQGQKHHFFTRSYAGLQESLAQTMDSRLRGNDKTAGYGFIS